MISILLSEYTLTSLLSLCLQLILPIIIFLISFCYISNEQQNWYLKDLKVLSNINILFGNTGIFLGIVIFIFTGIASLLVLNYKFDQKITSDSSNKFLKNINSTISNAHFYMFPIMVLLSTFGYEIAYQTKSFIPHLVMVTISFIINIYLMIFYIRKMSYVISLFLIPMFIWQIINISTFILGTEEIAKK